MGCNGLQAIVIFRWEEISGKQNVVTSEKRSWHGTSVMLVAWPIKTISDIAIHTLQGYSVPSKVHHGRTAQWATYKGTNVRLQKD